MKRVSLSEKYATFEYYKCDLSLSRKKIITYFNSKGNIVLKRCGGVLKLNLNSMSHSYPKQILGASFFQVEE